jgi:glutamate 5-kinase
LPGESAAPDTHDVAVSQARSQVGAARTLVVKVGSSSLTTAGGGLDPVRLDQLVDAVASRVAAGSHVVLVSSGAIAAGLAPLGLRRRPRDLPTQQAAASVGQQQLAARYADSFARHGLKVGQVLLTSDDVVRRAHYHNAQRTFGRLLHFGVVPVVNENDTVATTEIRFGDNDRLAALVAHLVGADALVLLSDVDALYTGDPRLPESTPIAEVVEAAQLAGVALDTAGSGLGTGGMASKVTAALIATGAGIPVLLADAAHATVALEFGTGPAVGTAFAAAARRTSARLFWLKHAATASGALAIDAGAVAAVTGRRKSLLPAGITGVRGEFESGDVVDLIGPAGAVVARGFVAHDAAELPAIIGRHLSDLPEEQRREVVHADDLVVLRRAPRRPVAVASAASDTAPAAPADATWQA